MNNLMQTFALIEMSITCAAVIILLLQKTSAQPFPVIVKVLLILLIANLFFWPLGLGMELPLVAYVRGVVGDLSIVTMLLLWTSLLPKNKPAPFAFKFALALIAIIFYPLALGLGMMDPYAWGYGSIGFFIAVLFFALVCGLAHWSKGVWIIAIGILAWAGHWHESANLWDYLLDPFLAIWALTGLIAALYRRRRDKARSGYLFRPG
ncbi:hypothetical protein B6A14_09580 [Polynucleobacter hirudinilacicola]|uniref:Uncharacterized protein n=1 Tax=Polynucleobacter hirudinilacicola TaxID=1743166 RepID=A0A210RYB9_9BURK|nr:hypothetical protein [Polynucleobacter hirudinilacicola]OWF65989.1 hypothetical protein B6A14_09580 [Polynucleobacter hirudinilacicola]